MLRIFRSILIAVVLLLVFSIYGLWAAFEWLETDAGKQKLVEVIEEAVKTPESELKIGFLKGSLFSSMTFSDIALKDREGLWLKINRLKLRWDPWTLFARKVSIQGISFDSIEVIRKPLAPKSERPESGKKSEMQFPLFPVSIEINRLAAEQIRLYPPVLGEEVRASLESRMGYWGLSRGVVLNLLLTRIDQTPGSLDFKMTFIPPTQTLVVDLKAYEPEGGILVRTLEVPDLPEMSATIHGDGTLEEWNGRFNLVAGENLGLEGQAEIRTVTETTYGMNLLMIGNVASLVNPELKNLLGDSQKLNARLMLKESDHLKVEEAEMSVPAGHLSLQGDVRFAEESLNLRYKLTAGDSKSFASLIPGIRWESLTGSGTAKGRQTHPQIDLHLEAKSFSQAEFSVFRTSVDLRLTPDRPFTQKDLAVAFKGQGEIHQLRGPNPVIQKIGKEPLRWSFQGTLYSETGLIELNRLESLFGGNRLNFSGRLDEWGRLARVKGNVSLPDISPYSEIVQRNIAGGVELDWQADIQDFGNILEGEISSVVTHLDPGVPEIKALAGERLTLSGKVRRGHEGLIRVKDFTLKRPGLSALVNATLDREKTLQTDWSVNIPDMAVMSSVFGQKITGDMTLKGSAEGSLLSPILKAKIQSQSLTVNEVSIRQATVQFHLNDLMRSPNGNVDAIAVVNGYGASAFTDFILKDGNLLLLQQTRFSAFGSQLKGNLNIGLSPASASGSLTGRIIDFADINALLDKELSGNVVLKLGLSEKEGQSAKFDLQAENLKIKGESFFSARSVTLSGKAVQVLKVPAIESQLQIKEATLSGVTVQKTILNAKGTVKALDFDLDTEFQPEASPPANIMASGNLKIEDVTQNVQLKTFKGSVSRIPFQMVQPTILILSGSNIEMKTLILDIEEGRVKGGFTKNQNGILANVWVEHLPLGLVNTFHPALGMGGKLKGKIELSALKANPEGNFQFSATELILAKAVEKSLAPSTAEFQGKWNGKMATVNFHLKQPSLGDFEANGEIPLTMHSEATGFSLPQKAHLKGTAKGLIDLDILNDIVLTNGDQVKGKVKIAIEAKGTVEKPEMMGKIKLEGGLYESLKLGTTVDGIEMIVSLDKDHIQIDKLNARTPKKGTIDGSGDIKKSEKGKLVANLNLKTHSAQLAATDAVSTQVTSDLYFTGPIESALLNGEIKIDRAEIYVPNNLPPDIVILEVEETNDQESEGKIKIESPEKKEPKFDVKLDVKVHAPNQVFVRGRGLDAELEGDLFVKGSMNNPVVDGALQLRRGQMDLLGRKVKFKHGVVGLEGVPKRDPQLDFKAEVPAKEITMLVAVMGSVSNPKIELSSMPEMPKDEILARFLFDKSAGAMTPLEAVQLANSAAQLAGLGADGPGFMDQIRSSLGLDTLKFSGGEGKSGPGVEVGRYISEGVYLGVKQGLGDNSSSAIIEYEVTPNISLESDIGADAQSRLGINMEWDY